jgi:hypothetical protein
MAPGDGYILANNVITRQVTDGANPVNGIMEAVALPGAAIAEGPMTYDYVPANTGLNIIGIEDADAEFECTSTTALAITAYDAGAIVGIEDTAPDTTLRQSRQGIGAIGIDGFILVRPVDRTGNDSYAQYARVVVKLRPVNLV